MNKQMSIRSFTKIANFATIKEHILPKTLVAFDFDETIQKYTSGFASKDWWKLTFDKYQKIHNDYDIADKYTYDEWKDKLTNEIFDHTDKDGLFKLIKETRDAGNYFVIVTARGTDTIDITKKQLSFLELEPDKLTILSDIGAHHSDGVFYVSGKSKGFTITEICKELELKNVVFVDDMHYNLEDVSKLCENNSITIYPYHALFDSDKN